MINIYWLAAFFVSGFIGLSVNLKMFKISENEQSNEEFHKKYDFLFLVLAIISFSAFGFFLYDFL